MESIQTGRHPILPPHLNAEDLANWLLNSAVERFTDKQKRIFSPDELQEFEHESSVNGREINRLMDQLADAAAHVKKGCDEPLVITFPATKGTKMLDTFRRQNDDLIESGFELDEKEIFGIPNADAETMEYFDIEGKHVAERSRPMSAKERHDHLGMFQKGKSKMFIPGGFEQNGGSVTDTETGEMLDGTND